jgi:hypothetical protein
MKGDPNQEIATPSCESALLCSNWMLNDGCDHASLLLECSIRHWHVCSKVYSTKHLFKRLMDWVMCSDFYPSRNRYWLIIAAARIGTAVSESKTDPRSAYAVFYLLFRRLPRKRFECACGANGACGHLFQTRQKSSTWAHASPPRNLHGDLMIVATSWDAMILSKLHDWGDMCFCCLSEAIFTQRYDSCAARELRWSKLNRVGYQCMCLFPPPPKLNCANIMSSSFPIGFANHDCMILAPARLWEWLWSGFRFPEVGHTASYGDATDLFVIYNRHVLLSLFRIYRDFCAYSAAFF